jgi:hypothetical protein
VSRVELHIERVVLDGIALDRAGARRLEAALASRLTELLREGASPGGGFAPSNVRNLRAAPIALDPSAGPARMGTQLADAVHGALGGGR